MIKWCNQPYDSASWEPQSHLEADYEDEEELQSKIQQFRSRNQLPHIRDLAFYDKYLPPGVRSNPALWRKLEEANGEAEYKDGNRLRPYQLEGVNWLLYCWYHNQSSIIADEMGLGK